MNEESSLETQQITIENSLKQIDLSPSKNEIGRSTIDIREPTDEHLQALRNAFNKILHERILSDENLQLRQILFQQFQQIIQSKWSDCQINLYGSLLFDCCLEKPGMMDIDVHLKQIPSYDTLKEIFDLINQTNFCKEININTEHKPSCIDLITNESNIRIRITSGYNRGIYLSKLIRIYTKFDSRLIKLLRLFRILAKTCNIDKPDFGTLHPIVFHLMVIHFLQQIDPPILPCLHEYVFGIDHVPLNLLDNQYTEFFRICNNYSQQWKSKNLSTIELLFLQLLSYYVKTFHSKQFVVSIQTRMPVVKIDKNWHSRKLLVEDPLDIKRSLCQTMQSIRSINYFRETLNTALNYFGRKQKLVEEENEIPIIESKYALHNSYELVSNKFSRTIIRDIHIRQDHVRDLYKKLFDNEICQPLMISNEFEYDDENELFQRIIFDDDDEQINRKQSIVRQLFSTEKQEDDISSTSQIDQMKISDIYSSDILPSVFTTPIKIEQISMSDHFSSEYFYDFHAENFHAEQGAPFVCTTCNGVGHLKSECPELIVPNMIDLPDINDEWLEILSVLCLQITERCQPTVNDRKNREEILKQLQKQFEKDYPDCSLHAFGSFYNGFGFRQSDLDVCIVFKDRREENTDEVIQIMRKILKSMRSNSDSFENVQPVLHAKVPIIRSRHRKLQIEIDISLHNMLAIENTRLLKTYTEIDPRVSQLGYMIKHLAKTCDIGDASRGTLSSYAYIIMLIYFLQQIQPAVLPVLQELTEDKNLVFKQCSKWNVYFYDDLIKLNTLWKNENHLSTGALWIEFLRFYTEQFNSDEYVVTIRQKQLLTKHEKGWFRQTIAIEDPFELSHNLAGGLSIKNWTIIRRVLIRARQQFGLQNKEFDLKNIDMQMIESKLFNIDDLCPNNIPRRCIECQGPYHIRKHCPKLITLAAEKKDKFKQQYQYNLSMMSYQQRIWIQPYSNNDSYFNRSFYSNHRRRKLCFRCGSSTHIQSQCPQFHR